MKSTLTNMVLSLGTITIVASALLSGVYSVTKEPIELAKEQGEKAAIEAVTPTFDQLLDPVEVTPEDATAPIAVFPVSKDGKLAGAAVRSYSDNGFSGHISVMYGFDTEGNVTNYEVLEQAETPGLGVKMIDWFKGEGARSVIGLNPAQQPLTVSKDGGQVDAITAATISSRAFLDALNRASRAFELYKAQSNQ